MASFSYILFQLKREHVQPWLFFAGPIMLSVWSSAKMYIWLKAIFNVFLAKIKLF